MFLLTKNWKPGLFALNRIKKEIPKKKKKYHELSNVIKFLSDIVSSEDWAGGLLFLLKGDTREYYWSGKIIPMPTGTVLLL